MAEELPADFASIPLRSKRLGLELRTLVQDATDGKQQ